MPKVKTEIIKRGFRYEYDCECGCKMTLETDVKPKRLTKCYECIKKNNIKDN